MLGFGSDHKSGHILHKEQRCPVTATGFYKVRDLFSGFSINDSTESRRPTDRIAKHSPGIGDHSDLHPTHARMAGDNFAGIVRLKFIEMTGVENTVEQLAHII